MVTKRPSILDALKDRAHEKAVILCMGNIRKCDGGIGVKVGQMIDGKVIIPVINCGQSPHNYINPIKQKQPRTVIIVDAVDMKLSPGAVRVISPKDIKDSTFEGGGTSLRTFADIVAAETDAEVVIIAVQPKRVSFGMELSDEAQSSADKIAAQLMEAFPKHAS